MMKKHEEFRWMRLRIRRMADAWIQAIRSLAEKQNLEKRKRKKVGSLLIQFSEIPICFENVVLLENKTERNVGSPVVFILLNLFILLQLDFGFLSAVRVVFLSRCLCTFLG